ncbi:MAG: Asp-tRNA(Asn)/Glu-tRNA(Gln) amidotransferase subunit GatA [Ferruginibacter sp.]
MNDGIPVIYFSQFYKYTLIIITKLFNNIQLYHQQLRSGNTSCVEVVEHYLNKISQNKRLNAFTEVYAGEALLKGAQLDEKQKRGESFGRLHGVIIAIKDVLCYQDHLVTAASKILEGFVSVYNATAIQRLLDEDAIIIGACNCDEFAMGSTNENSAYGNVLNALDETRVPGGSSGGSAVAVQAGMCMVSLGSDTGGSVRQPADFCGVIGLKPTYGRISRYGLVAYASSFDQIGIFSTDLENIALTLDVIAGADDYDSTALPGSFHEKKGSAEKTLAGLLPGNAQKKYRIAYFKEALDHPSLDKEISEQIFTLIGQLISDGHKVEAVEFDLLDHIVPAYYVLTTAEASSNLSRYDGVRYGHRTKEPVSDLAAFYNRSRSEGFGKEVKRRILLGTFVLSAGYYDAYFGKAQQVRRLLVDKTTAIFNNYDAILLPTAPTTAMAIGENQDDPIAVYLADIYTVFANLTGIPAISIPLFMHSNGMPFGVQILTNKEEELPLLHLSNLLMQEHKVRGTK